MKRRHTPLAWNRFLSLNFFDQPNSVSEQLERVLDLTRISCSYAHTLFEPSCTIWTTYLTSSWNLILMSWSREKKTPSLA